MRNAPEIVGVVLGAWVGLSLLVGVAFTLAASYHGRRGRRAARKREAQQERLAQVVLFPRREVKGVVRQPPAIHYEYSPLEHRIHAELDRGGPGLTASVQSLIDERR